MSISSEIAELQTNLTNAYSACTAKGATLPAHQNFDNLANCIDSISTGGSSEEITRYTQSGTTADARSVTLANSTFDNITSIANRGMMYSFYYKPTTLSGDLTFNNLTSVGDNGLQYGFGYTGISSASFPSLSIVGAYSFSYCFSGCNSLDTISFPAFNGGTSGNIYTSFNSVVNGSSNVTIKFPINTCSTIGGWINETVVSGTNTAITFSLPESEQFFAQGLLTYTGDSVSGFSSSNYLEMDRPFESSGVYKIILNLTVKTGVLGGNNPFFCRRDNIDFGAYIQKASMKFGYYDSTSKLISNPITAGKTYWYEIVHDASTGSSTQGYLEDDGTYTVETLPDISTWPSGNTNSFSTSLKGTRWVLGMNRNTGLAWQGSIDISKCAIYRDGSIWWRAKGQGDRNIYIWGDPTMNSSNYNRIGGFVEVGGNAGIRSYINPISSYSTIRCITKVSAYNLGSQQFFFGLENQGSTDIAIYIMYDPTDKFCFVTPDSTRIAGTTTPSNGDIYFLQAVVTPYNCTLYSLKDNNNTYTLETLPAITDPAWVQEGYGFSDNLFYRQTLTKVAIAKETASGLGLYCRGSIFLDCTAIYVDNDLYWRAKYAEV